MSSVMEVDGFIDPATMSGVQAEPERYVLKQSPAIDAVLVALDALLCSAVELEGHIANAGRVDGEIIGTGEADFTNGNTVYTLKQGDKTFQLLDVPGIEGNETKYAQMVEAAVAKAHMVFYINGTNKKPEKATAAKIKSYLRRGTRVCPIVNMRGSADAYEFEEDRQSLENNGEALKALEQTVGVLRTELGSNVLLPAHCVQGLLAFSALAIDRESRKTTIHPSRENDLVVQQRNYHKCFASAKLMFEFSQMLGLRDVVSEKLVTFKEDIIESNKAKVRELLNENVDILQKALAQHQGFIDRINPEFEKCIASIKGAIDTFERVVTAARKNLWEEFFNELAEEADKIVANHFGDDDRIASKIKSAFKTRQEKMPEPLQAQLDEQMAAMQQSIEQAMNRLIEDVRRVEFQEAISFGESAKKAEYESSMLDMDLGLKEWGSFAFNIGSYAMAGATVGTVFPVIGNVIGAIAGAVVGLLVSAWEFASGKDKRIRKAQRMVQGKIDEARDDVLNAVSDEIATLMRLIKDGVKTSAQDRIAAVHESLKRPLKIISQQIALMNEMKHQLEKMPYGTIQAIQR
jgi:gas vesicle protein